MEEKLYRINNNEIYTCCVHNIDNYHYCIDEFDKNNNLKSFCALNIDIIKRFAYESLDGNKKYYYFFNKIYYTNLEDTGKNY